MQKNFVCNDRNMNYQMRLVHLNFNYYHLITGLSISIVQLNLENYVKSILLGYTRFLMEIMFVLVN